MRARGDVTRAVVARLVPSAMVGVGLAVALGAMGEEFRGLGVLALSELVVTRGLRLLGWLGGRPLARAAVRLAVAAVALSVLGASMPPVRLVASLFVVEGIIWLGWVGVNWWRGCDQQWLRAQLELAAVVSGIGVWFVSVPLPPSGWSPVVGVLLGSAAVASANRRQAVSVEEER